MNPVFSQILLQMNKTIAEQSNLAAMFDEVMATVVELVNAQRGFVLTIDPSGNPAPQVVYDTISTTDAAIHELSMSIVLHAMQKREAVNVNDALTDPNFGDAKSVQAFQIRSVICAPLISRDEVVGAIYVENRSKANMFKPDDVETLQMFSAQIAVSIHNALLNDMLRTSREKIVVAREEERRMLRRELHDSLGPQLSGMILELGAAIAAIEQHPQRAIDQLESLKHELQQSVNDVRQLTRNLRPPSLDDLGLVESLQDYLQNRVQSAGLHAHLRVSPALPALSAALEVAIYRITVEALTNTLKYASAHTVDVVLATDENTLVLTIQDDGTGLPDDLRTGVGLVAMRERAEEIGGQFSIANRDTGGTIVRASFTLK